MKKRFLFVLCAILALSLVLCACSAKKNDDMEKEETTIEDNNNNENPNTNDGEEVINKDPANKDPDNSENNQSGSADENNEAKDTDSSSADTDKAPSTGDGKVEENKDTDKAEDAEKEPHEDTPSKDTDGKKEIDIDELYKKLCGVGEMPGLIHLDEMFMSDFYGIMSSYYDEAIVACSETGIDVDEIWIIKTTDKDSCKKVADLAKIALKNKKASTKDYLPEEYAIASKGEIIVKGDYVFYLVSPYVDKMADIVNDAF